MVETKIFDMLLALRDRCLFEEEHIRQSLKLTPSEFKALLQINPDEIVGCHEFTGRLGLSESRSSRVIDRLVRRSILQRLETPSDRRCKQVRLTKKGIQLHLHVRKGVNSCEQRLTASIPPQRLQAVKAALAELLQSSSFSA